jgi:hypothetical protein
MGQRTGGFHLVDPPLRRVLQLYTYSERDKEGMMETIRRLEGVDPQEGINNYGNVAFADPVNNRFPLDTPERVRQSYRLFDMEAKSSPNYTAEEAELVLGRISQAARAQGVEIDATTGGSQGGHAE